MINLKHKGNIEVTNGTITINNEPIGGSEVLSVSWINQAPDPYLNISNETDTILPLNSNPLNTSADVFEVTNNRVHIKKPGIYRFDLFLNFFDMHSNIRFLSSLFESESSTGSVQILFAIERNIGNGESGTSSAHKSWNSSVFVQVNSPKYYGIILNANKNQPFPSSGSRPSTLTVTKIR